MEGERLWQKQQLKKAPSKTEILTNIANATDLPKKKVGEVLEALAAEIKKNLSSRGPGMLPCTVL